MCFLEHLSPCLQAPILTTCMNRTTFQRRANCTYLVVERAIHTILFCAKDVCLVHRVRRHERRKWSIVLPSEMPLMKQFADVTWCSFVAKTFGNKPRVTTTEKIAES